MHQTANDAMGVICIRAIRKERINYKRKVESHFKNTNMKKVWEGMKLMSGYVGKNSNSDQNLLNPTMDYVNDLNKLYNRFDCHDFNAEIAIIRSDLSSSTSDEHFICTESFASWAG